MSQKLRFLVLHGAQRACFAGSGRCVAYESFQTLIRPEWPQWILCINLKSGANRIVGIAARSGALSPWCVSGGVVHGKSQRNALTVDFCWTVPSFR